MAQCQVLSCVGNTCCILVDREIRRDSKADEGIFLGYSSNSRAYLVYNTRTRSVMESVYVAFDDVSDPNVTFVDDDTSEVVHSNVESGVPNNSLDKSSERHLKAIIDSDQPVTVKQYEADDKYTSSRVSKNHLPSNIIGSLKARVINRRKDKMNYLEMISNMCFTYSIET